MTVFESSPLGRVIEQSAYGIDFQPGSGHTKLIKYGTNTATDSVRLFKTDGSSTSFYPVNELTKLEVINEDQKKKQIFTDKEGRTILSRVQLDENVLVKGVAVFVPWLETYNIYNEGGSVKFIISPKGVQALSLLTGLLPLQLKISMHINFIMT
jgi:hypothetical protein